MHIVIRGKVMMDIISNFICGCTILAIFGLPPDAAPPAIAMRMPVVVCVVGIVPMVMGGVGVVPFDVVHWWFPGMSTRLPMSTFRRRGEGSAESRAGESDDRELDDLVVHNAPQLSCFRCPAEAHLPLTSR